MGQGTWELETRGHGDTGTRGRGTRGRLDSEMHGDLRT